MRCCLMDIAIVLAVLASVLYGTRLYFVNKNDVKALENEVKKQALELFLYAEKQGWDGLKKMDFAVQTLTKQVEASKLAKVVGTDTVDKWMQKFYDEVKAKIESEVKNL